MDYPKALEKAAMLADRTGQSASSSARATSTWSSAPSPSCSAGAAFSEVPPTAREADPDPA